MPDYGEMHAERNRRIYEIWLEGSRTQQQIGQEFGLSQSSIGIIVNDHACGIRPRIKRARGQAVPRPRDGQTLFFKKHGAPILRKRGKWNVAGQRYDKTHTPWCYVVLPQETEHELYLRKLAEGKVVRVGPQIIPCPDCGLTFVRNKNASDKRCPGCRYLRGRFYKIRIHHGRLEWQGDRPLPKTGLIDCPQCGHPTLRLHGLTWRCKPCENRERADKQKIIGKRVYLRMRDDPLRWAETQYRRSVLRKLYRQLNKDPSQVEQAVLAQLEQLGIIPASEQEEADNDPAR